MDPKSRRHRTRGVATARRWPRDRRHHVGGGKPGGDGDDQLERETMPPRIEIHGTGRKNYKNCGRLTVDE